jgi:hypothetical protein
MSKGLPQWVGQHSRGLAQTAKFSQFPSEIVYDDQCLIEVVHEAKAKCSGETVFCLLPTQEHRFTRGKEKFLSGRNEMFSRFSEVWKKRYDARAACHEILLTF